MVNDKTLGLILGDLRKECDLPIKLFAAFKMDDITDKWSIIVATDQVTQEVKMRIFSNLVELFTRHLDENERNNIARIGTFSVHDHLIELILSKYKTGDQITADQKINGNIIHEGYIVLAGREQNAEMHPEA